MFSTCILYRSAVICSPSGTVGLRACGTLCRAGERQRPRADQLSTASLRRAGHGKSGGGGHIHLKDASSQRWLTRQMKDPYVKQARLESWRCRSAFKLIEIDERFSLLAAGMTVIDCGAAPGSWSQVAVRRVNSLAQDTDKPRGTVISIDRDYFDPVEGALTFRNADVTDATVREDILRVIGGSQQRQVDVVLSDMAPNASGHPSLDHERIVELSLCALRFGAPLLRAGGAFLCKLWQGYLLRSTADELQLAFQSVRTVKPPASRDDSAEIFLLACGYRVPPRAEG